MASNLGNKKIMSDNIKYYMMQKGVSSTDVCKALGIPESTFSYWLTCKTYPRIDKIEMMSNYFGITKADLVEKRKPVNVFKEIGLQFHAGTEEPSAGIGELSDDERDLLEAYRDLNGAGQKKVKSYMNDLSIAGIYKRRDDHAVVAE